ncbi:MAG: ribonuclease Z [Patulibacter sp.]
MNLDLLFVGTGGSAPTARRGLPAVLLQRGGEHVLIDCGEGTQRQLMRSSGLVELDLVLITHQHTDHWLGLPGLLKTLDLREREAPLTVAGPVGLAATVALIWKLAGPVRYPVEVRELAPYDQIERNGWAVDAIPVRHRGTALGYVVEEHNRPGRFDPDRARELGVTDVQDFGRLQRGETVGDVTPDQVLGATRFGRKIVFSGDTQPCDAVREAAWRADVLVHEATFTAEQVERAQQTGHSTAAQAAALAKDADVGLLALTHLSARHRPSDAVAEARRIFPDTVMPRDFDMVRVPFPERGDPVHAPGAGRPARGGPSGGSDGATLDDPEAGADGDDDAPAAAERTDNV